MGIMADTGNVKPRLNPLLPPTPKLMLPLMLTTDTTVTVWDTVDTMVDITDTPMVDTDIVTGKEMLKPKLNPKLMPLPMLVRILRTSLQIRRILRFGIPWILRIPLQIRLLRQMVVIYFIPCPGC